MKMTASSTVERRRYDSHRRTPPSNHAQKQLKSACRYNSHHENEEEEEKKSDSSGALHLSHLDQNDNGDTSRIRQPQDLTESAYRAAGSSITSSNKTKSDGVEYFRVVYRGVVALSTLPDPWTPRSGCYLGYGEVVASRCQMPVAIEDGEVQLTAIRVDQILTGGYAYDPPSTSTLSDRKDADTSETPKKSNTQGYTTTTTISAHHSSPSVNLAISDSKSLSSEEISPLDFHKLESSTSDAMRCEHEGVHHFGFIFSHNRKGHQRIIQPLGTPPKCEHGQYFYKIISTTPLPILSGPSLDAPLSKAMVLPGTIHEVSFRIQVDDSNTCNNEQDPGVWFLRLGRRKGFIASCRIGRSRQHQNLKNEVLVKDVTEEIHASGIGSNRSVGTDDAATIATSASGSQATSSVLSVLSKEIAPCAAARSSNRRHRPPRRRRENASEDIRMARINRLHNANHHPLNNSMNVQPNDTSTLTDMSVQSANLGHVHPAPSSNVSLLSDESFSIHQHHPQHASFSSHETNYNSHYSIGPMSPDRSIARSVASQQNSQRKQQQSSSSYYLMRVTAPRGLRILDAPHFQVNNLIHGQQSSSGSVATSILAPNSSADVNGLSGLNSNKNQHHLFHTMAGRITTTNGIGPTDNAMIFDSVTKTRILPRGAVFEASKRMEPSDAVFGQGAGLIKLADNSGWAIVPHPRDLEQQYLNFHGGVSSVKEGEATRGGYEEIGSAVVFQPTLQSEAVGEQCSRHAKKQDSTASAPGIFMRIVARQGATVVCTPPTLPLKEDNNCQSPTSSQTSSAVSGGTPDLVLGKSDSASDVGSSVASSFLDSMFRNKRMEGSVQQDGKQDSSAAHLEKASFVSSNIPCGICVQVEPHIPPDQPQRRKAPQEFARLKDGQGWIPLFISGKPSCVVCPRSKSPEFRHGSFWFRVQAQRGIKVRLGPSKRAPSIKSSDGEYFRFECGEFLRASEIMTVFRDDSHGRTLSESFAKLYRNRHVRLAAAAGNEQFEFRSLASMTCQSEWVQVHDDSQNELYLKECQPGPRIERHRQGWRYRVTTRSGVAVKKGPSFEAEDTGNYVEEGESVVIIERVTCFDENGVTWLRMKDGKGWLHDVERDSGETLLIPHTLRARVQGVHDRPVKPRRPSIDDKNQQIAYNTIIARLFHNDLPSDHPHSHGEAGSKSRTVHR